MQCPDCKIYFDDEEKACPMCGRKRITMGHATQRVTQPSAFPVQEGRVTNRKQYQSYGAAKPKPVKPPRSRNPKQARTVVAVLVVVWLVLVFSSIVSSLSYSTVEMYDEATVPDSYEWDTDEWDEYNDSYSDAYEIRATSLFPNGISVSSGEQRLEITFESNDAYRLTRVGDGWSASETGWSYTFAQADYFYSEQFPETQYECYELSLLPYEFSVTGQGYDQDEWALFYEGMESERNEYRVFALYVDLQTGESTLFDYYDENFELLFDNVSITLPAEDVDIIQQGNTVA